MKRLDPDEPHTMTGEGAEMADEQRDAEFHDLPAGHAGGIHHREEQPRLSGLLPQLGHRPRCGSQNSGTFPQRLAEIARAEGECTGPRF